MNARRSLGRSFRELVEKDLDIMPLMNLFVALIPMLLISAVFLNVTVIEMDAPPEGLVDDVDQISARLVKMLVRSGESAASKRKAA